MDSQQQRVVRAFDSAISPLIPGLGDKTFMALVDEDRYKIRDVVVTITDTETAETHAVTALTQSAQARLVRVENEAHPNQPWLYLALICSVDELVQAP